MACARSIVATSFRASVERQHNRETKLTTLNAAVAGFHDSRSACSHSSGVATESEKSRFAKIQSGMPRVIERSRAPFGVELMHALIAMRRKKNLRETFLRRAACEQRG